MIILKRKRILDNTNMKEYVFKNYSSTLYIINLKKIDIVKFFLESKKKNPSLKDINAIDKLSLASLILKDLLFKITNHKHNELYFNEYGAPIIDGVNFSLTHALNLCLILIAKENIGLDTLDIRIKNDLVINKYFNDKEKEYIDKLNLNKEKDFYFSLFWSIKESVSKYLKIGINKKMKEYEIDLLNKKVYINDKKETLNLDYEIKEDQIISYVYKEKIKPINYIELTESEIKEAFESLKV